MVKVKRISLLILLMLAVVITAGIFGGAKKVIYESNPYSFYFESYDVVYDVSSDRQISIEEKLTITFTGSKSTGFIRDIPINAGEQVKNIEVYSLSGGNRYTVAYDVYTEESTNSNDKFMCIDIGDMSNKTGQTHQFLITYDYCLTKETNGKNSLDLNLCGLGRDCEIKRFSAQVILPEGLESIKFTVGDGEESDEPLTDYDLKVADGKTVITLSYDNLDNYYGVSMFSTFEDGALSFYTDLKPFWFTLAGVIILLIVILLSIFVFNKHKIMPVVNYDAPDKMDPLIMGKLIDNKVNSEDITSLLFYWADKGFIKINFDDKNDPCIIRVNRYLPDEYPAYQKYMYENIFRSGDAVKPSQLKNSFYKVVDKVTSMVNGQTKNLYDSKSIGISVIFAILGGLLLGLAPLLLGLTNISVKYFVFAPFIVLIPMLFIYAFSETIMYNRHKYGKKKSIGLGIALLLANAVVCAFYSLLMPKHVMGILPSVTLYITSCLTVMCSVFIISYTKDYALKLGDILGFKNFITLTEKDQLLMMLESDPQFYYHILPYAQVLGVTDIWEDKFKNITMQPPKWATGSFVTTYIEISVVNSLIRSSFGKFSQGMVSRPSSSGSSGGSRGFGSGHTGGGHGGGGFRGR